MSELQIIRNDNGQAVYLAGKLPDGTFGVVADELRPFTESELTNANKFKTHKDDLAKRVDASMGSSDE